MDFESIIKKHTVSANTSKFSEIAKKHGINYELDNDYISNYVNEANALFSSVQKDYDSLNYGNSSSVSEKNILAGNEIIRKSNFIRGYLGLNKNSLTEESYNQLLELADSGYKKASTVRDVFKNAKDYYSQWTSEEDYNIWTMNNTTTSDEDSKKQRLDIYNTNVNRIAEIESEIQTLKNEGMRTKDFIETGGFGGGGGREYKKQAEIDALNVELKKLKNANTIYERFNKLNDEIYSAYLNAEDFDQNSGYISRQEYIENWKDPNKWDSIGPYQRFLDFYNKSPKLEDHTYKSSDGKYDVADEYFVSARSNGWNYATENEFKTLNYIANTQGDEAAQEYFNNLSKELSYRRYVAANEESAEKYKNATWYEKVGMNIESIPQNILGSINQGVGAGIGLLTDSYDPYDYASTEVSRIGAATRENTAKELNKLTNNGEFLGLTLGDAYQAGMSGVDSAVGSLMFGKAFSVIMGMGTAADTARDLYERGATQEQIALGGVLAGTAEAVFEKISIEYFLENFIKSPNKNFGEWFLKSLAQRGIEMSEETVTEIANIMSDAMVMGSQSEWEKILNNYKNLGYSDSEAISKTLLDMGGRVWKAGASGFISGGSMSDIAGGISLLTNKNSTKKNFTTTEDSVAFNTKAVTNPIESYPAAKQNIIKSFINSVDENIKSFVESVKNGDLTNRREKITDVSERTISDIKRLLGVDVSGYAHSINTSGVQHILKRHGENGQHDNSMSSDEDIARVGWVLENYDSVEPLLKDGKEVYSSEFKNNENVSAPQIKYTKKINGTYYVVEAAFENKNKKIWVQTAYLTKNKEDVTQEYDADFVSPHTTSKNELASPSSNNRVPQKKSIVNNKSMQINPENSENSDFQSTAVSKISTLSAANPEYNPIEDLHYQSVGVERLTSDQRKLRKVGQQFGAKVSFKDLDEIRIDEKTGKEFLFSPEGQFDPDTNTITLNTNVKDYHRPLEYILKHELAHSLEIDKDNYALFATQVLNSDVFKNEYVHSKGFESTDAWAAEIIKQYSRKGVKGYQGSKAQLLANQEMIANFVGDMLFGGRTDITEKLLNSMTPTQRKGFIAKIKEFFAKLKQFFKGAAELTEIERLENLFLETANKVAEYNKTATEGSGDIVYSFKNGNYSESKAIIDIIKKNIIKISSELRFSVKGSTIDRVTRKSDYVLNIFKQQGGEAFNSEIGVVELTRSGAKSTVFHGFGSQKLAATEAIKSVIEKGNIISFTKNYDNTGVDRYVIAAKGEINGEPSYVGVVVKSYPNSKSNSKFYLHEALIIEKDSPIMTAPQLSVDAVSESSNYSIPENENTVNNNYVQSDKQYSFAVQKDKSITDKAEQLERELKSKNKTDAEIREAIWKEYQIIRDPEGVWKYEIDDSDMEIYPNGDLLIKDHPDYKEYKALEKMKQRSEKQDDRFAQLDDMFLLEHDYGRSLLKNYVKHDKLFAKYPQLKEAKIDFDELAPGERGYYDSINNRIVLDERFKMQDKIAMNIVAIHEIQHAMQEIDDTEPGASEEYWNARLLRGERLPINPKTNKPYTPFEAYERTRGEIEAREAASRVDMTEKQRRETVPNFDWENSLSAREPVLAGEYDAEYSSAVESGNIAKAQRMVDAAAELFGYTERLYHQTDADFTEFNTNNQKAGKYDWELPTGTFLKPTADDIGLSGKKQMELYANIKNPLEFANRYEAQKYWSENIPGYDNAVKEVLDIDAKYRAKVDAAVDAIQHYSKEWKRKHPNESRRAIYNDAEYQRLSDKQADIIEEWESVSNKASLKAKKLIDSYITKNNYDGIIIERDKDGENRETKSYIVFSSAQLKSAAPVTYDDSGNVVSLSERFNENQSDIRYSIPETNSQTESYNLNYYQNLLEYLTEKEYNILTTKKPIKVRTEVAKAIESTRTQRYAKLSEEEIPILDIINLGEYNTLNSNDYYFIRNANKYDFSVIKHSRTITRRQDKYVDFKRRQRRNKIDGGFNSNNGSQGAARANDKSDSYNRPSSYEQASTTDVGLHKRVDDTYQRIGFGEGFGNIGDEIEVLKDRRGLTSKKYSISPTVDIDSVIDAVEKGEMSASEAKELLGRKTLNPTEIANLPKEMADTSDNKKGLILPEPDISKDMRSEAERISEIVGGKVNAKYVARQEVRELGKALGWKVLYGDVYAKDKSGNLIYIKDQDGNLVPKRAEAKVDKKNKTIIIDYQNKHPIKTIVKHELTHFLELNSKTYSGFAKKVFSSEVFAEWLSQEGVSDIDEYRDSIISQYIETKGFETIDAAETSADFEIVARFVADNLFNNDGQMMQRIAEMMNPTQRSKFYEFICSIFEKLKEFFKGKDGYSEVVALEREWVKAYRAANSVWESQFGDKTSRSTYSELETHFINKFISNLNEMKADSGESADFMPSARVRRSAPIDLFENINYNDDTNYGERLKNTPNSLKPTTEREWQTFSRSFANQTNGMRNNEYRIASVFTADNHYIIEADGYISGRIVSKSSIADYREKERFFDDYNSSKVFDVRNDRNGNRQGYHSNDSDSFENGGTDTFYVEMGEFIEQHPKWFANKGKTYRDFIRELNKKNNSSQADSGESAFSMPFDEEYFIDKHNLSVNGINNGYVENVAKKAKSRYNEYQSNVMQWAYSLSTNIGDVKLFNDIGKQFVLNEATEDGYIEIARGTYEELKEIEQSYKESTDTVYVHTTMYENAKTGDFTNNSSFKNKREYGQSGRTSESEQFSVDTTGNYATLRTGDKRESVKKQADSGESAFSMPFNEEYFIAKQRDISVTQKAEVMEKRLANKGLSDFDIAYEVWKKYGVVRDDKGEWVYEINDWDLHMNKHGRVRGNTGKKHLFLPDYIDLPQLYEVYPQLNDVEVIFESNLEKKEKTPGYYDPDTNQITLDKALLDNANKLEGVFIHEIQHAIQGIDGRESGSSVAFWQAYQNLFYHDKMPTNKDTSKENLEYTKMMYDMLTESLPEPVVTAVKEYRKANDEGDDDRAFQIYKDAMQDLEFYEMFDDYDFWDYKYHMLFEKGVNVLGPHQAFMQSSGEREARMVEQRYREAHETSQTLINALTKIGEKFTLDDIKKFMATYGRDIPVYRPDLAIFENKYKEEYFAERERTLKEMEENGLLDSKERELAATGNKSDYSSVEKSKKEKYNRENITLNTDKSKPDKSPKTEPDNPDADKTKPDKAETEKSKEKGATDDEVLEALLDGLGVEKDNVDITLKYKETWNDKQKAEADRKLKVLTEAKTKRTKVIRKSSSARKKYFNKNIPKDFDLDHIVDLQLGGNDGIDNISPLDKSVNRSLGSQIRHAIKKYPYETKFGKFIIK